MVVMSPQIDLGRCIAVEFFAVIRPSTWRRLQGRVDILFQPSLVPVKIIKSEKNLRILMTNWPNAYSGGTVITAITC